MARQIRGWHDPEALGERIARRGVVVCVRVAVVAFIGLLVLLPFAIPALVRIVLGILPR